MAEVNPPIYLPDSPGVQALFSGKIPLSTPAAIEVRRSSYSHPQPLRWQAEAAVDYLLYRSVPCAGRGSAGTGRGNRAAPGTARYDVLQSYAAGAGVTVQTIHLNMRAFALIQEVAKSIKRNSYFILLKKKSFFLLALKSSDPCKTLLEWIKTAEKNPRWRPHREGRQYLEKSRTSLPEHLRNSRSSIQNLLSLCPDAKFAKQLFGSFLEEIDDSLQLLAHKDLQDRVLKAYDTGYCTELEISSAVRLPRAEVRQILESLERERIMYCGEEVKKNLNQYKDYRWHRVGESLGSTLEIKQPFNPYVNKHEHW